MVELCDTSGVSIVICTYNGKPRLEKTLTHALGQITSIPFEVLLVDNASSDGTADYVHNFSKLRDHNSIIRIISEKEPGLSSARIRGIKESRFSLILFCDDDNWLAPDYLEIGKNIFDSHPKLGVLGGEGIAEFESSKPDWFDQYSHSFAVGDLGMKSGILPRGSAVYGAGCFFRKSALDKLLKMGWSSILSDRKGNTLSSGGDVELCYAIQLMDYSVGFENRLKFRHFLEEKRMNWEYYIKLKEGIASSFPLLDIYRYLLNGKEDKKEFLSHIQKTLFQINWAIVKLRLSNLFISTKERQLAAVIQKKRLQSYLYNKGLINVYFDQLFELSSR